MNTKHTPGTMNPPIYFGIRWKRNDCGDGSWFAFNNRQVFFTESRRIAEIQLAALGVSEENWKVDEFPRAALAKARDAEGGKG